MAVRSSWISRRSRRGAPPSLSRSASRTVPRYASKCATGSGTRQPRATAGAVASRSSTTTERTDVGIGSPVLGGGATTRAGTRPNPAPQEPLGLGDVQVTADAEDGVARGVVGGEEVGGV